MRIENIETPALVLDKKIFDKNISEMNKLLQNSSLALRPHYKSHKCARIATMQIQKGAKGITCAKLSEAQDLADCGIEDILIANQITDIKKIRALCDLALSCRLTVCVDNVENIRQLAASAGISNSTLYCLVEYEIGMNRCGVKTKEEVLALCREIAKHKNLVFEGIQAYAGHISHIVDRQERQELTDKNFEKIKELKAYLEENGFEVNTVSGGSTGTADIKKNSVYTELQAGSYLFMDSTYKELDVAFENSLFVLATVVSAKDGLTVVDAGVKTCGVDQGMPCVLGNKAQETVASEEHFQFHGLEKPLSLSDKVLLVPGHCCSTVNLHDRIYVVEDGKVVDRFDITGRKFGK